MEIGSTMLELDDVMLNKPRGFFADKTFSFLSHCHSVGSRSNLMVGSFVSNHMFSPADHSLNYDV